MLLQFDYLVHLVHPDLIGWLSSFEILILLIPSLSHFDPHFWFELVENIRIPRQLKGSTSIVELSLQSSIIPDLHSSPIELGLLMLYPLASFFKSVIFFGNSHWSQNEILVSLVEVEFFSQQKRISKSSHWSLLDNCWVKFAEHINLW